MSEFLLHDEQAAQVYLDANATTPVLPCIADVVSHTMQICFGNPWHQVNFKLASG